MKEAKGNGIVEMTYRYARENAKLKRKLFYWRCAFATLSVANLAWAWRLMQ